MFGEEPIFGNVIRSVDNKKRLALPKFTYADKRELLYMIQEMDGSVNIYNKKDIEALLKSIDEITNMIVCCPASRSGKIKMLQSNKEKILNLINNFYCNTSQVKTDDFKRINVAHSNLEPNKKYKLIGKGNSLLICESVPSSLSTYEKIKAYTRKN